MRYGPNYESLHHVQDFQEETKKRQTRENSSKNYIECFKYEYTRSVMAFSRKHEDTVDHICYFLSQCI